MLFIAFTLPLNKSLLPLLIVIMLILWFLEGNFKTKIQNLKSPFFILIISFYLFHLVGMIYTSNLKAGGFDLEQKLSLIIFPLLLFSDGNINQADYIKILKSFVLACALAGLICIINALYKFYLSGDVDNFFYSSFSAIMHASYFAMYVCFAIIILLFNKKVILNTILKGLLLLFFILLVVLVSSKSGVISLILILGIRFLYDIVTTKNYKRAFAMLLITCISATTIYLVFPKSAERLSQMKQTLNSSNDDINTTTSRIAIWKHAMQLISKHYILGVGTGDVKDALKETYEKKSETQFVEKQLNAHNQFLQTFIALGLPGILVLLSMLMVIVYQTFKNNCLEGTLLTCLIAFNMLFESMLETQAGVIFIAFFLSLYLSISVNHFNMKNTNIAA